VASGQLLVTPCLKAEHVTVGKEKYTRHGPPAAFYKGTTLYKSSRVPDSPKDSVYHAFVIQGPRKVVLCKLPMKMLFQPFGRACGCCDHLYVVTIEFAALGV